MTVQLEQQESTAAVLTGYKSILVAADSSDHANRGTEEAVELATLWGAKITGVHVYAAKLHDLRFRQMERGLPEKFREEGELEHQRNLHDDIITRGLSVISDSYLDQTEKVCRQGSVAFERRSPEGKNYRELVRECDSKRYDLLVIGALGLGASPGARLGTVCERVCRRTPIDTLVIKEPQRRIADGPIVVAVDGSKHAWGGLLTALELADKWQVPLQVVAAFDPYFHYVAFDRIAGVLSEEGEQIFKVEDQEQLHKDVIDSGLARIYQGHLDVAESIAADHGVEIETCLLTGKANVATLDHVQKVKPSLLVMGKLGVHADADLDIGGNAEHILQDCDCAALLSMRQHEPRLDVVAEVTTTWTSEAEEKLERIPGFVRGMARTAILRYAQDRGHTVITMSIVEEATAQLMPGHAKKKDSGGDDPVPEPKSAEPPNEGPDCHWDAAALSRLARVPDGFMRDMTRKRVDFFVRSQGVETVTLELLETKLAEWSAGSCRQEKELAWEDDVWARVQRIPEMIRGMIIKECESCAQTMGVSVVNSEVFEKARGAWESHDSFHSKHDPDLYK